MLKVENKSGPYSDIWTLGAIIYFIISSKLHDPYQGASDETQNIDSLLEDAFKFKGKRFS